MKTIKVSVGITGAPTIDTEGFVGEECKNVTKGLEGRFEGGSVDVVEKPEMHEEASNEESQHENWG